MPQFTATVVCTKFNDAEYLVDDEIQVAVESDELKTFAEVKKAVRTALRREHKETPERLPLWPYGQAVSGPVDMERVKASIQQGDLRLEATSYEKSPPARFGASVELNASLWTWYDKKGKPVKHAAAGSILLTVPQGQAIFDSKDRLVQLVCEGHEGTLAREVRGEDITPEVKPYLADAFAELLRKYPRCLVGHVLEARALDKLLHDNQQVLLGPYTSSQGNSGIPLAPQQSPKNAATSGPIHTLQQYLRGSATAKAVWGRALLEASDEGSLKAACYQLGYYQVRILIAELQQKLGLLQRVLKLTEKLNSILSTMKEHPDLAERIACARASQTSQVQKTISGFLGSAGEHRVCTICGTAKKGEPQ